MGTENDTEEGIEINKKYKIFDKTFRVCTMGLAVGLVYPNKETLYKRILIYFLIVAVNGLELFWFAAYLINSLKKGDTFNVTRHVTVGIVIFLFLFKTLYINYKCDKFKYLLTTISTDLLNGNEVDEDYQQIYDNFIAKGKIGERLWIFIPAILSALFPVSASATMIYNSFVGAENPYVMVHEMDLLYFEDVQYTTPYFELIFVYNVTQCAILAPVFIGFDGSYCISLTHLSMKLKLFTRKLQRAFDESLSNEELENKVRAALKDHQEALIFHELVQDVYGGWLFTAFFLTSTVVSFNLYQLSLSGGSDPRYLVFTGCAVFHVFAPCYYASNLLKVGQEVCNEIYEVPWEGRSNLTVTYMLTFAIARAQRPLQLTGKGMFVFSMELFVSVLQTSYSFYTLINS